MKKLSVLCILSCVFGIGTTFAYTSEDTSNANYLADQGIITKQTLASKYALDNKILRQEVIAMALQIKGIAIPTNTSCKKYFADTVKNDWVCRAVELAADNGIITRSNKYANPGKYVTRAEALAMIYNASGLTPGEMGIITYGDKDIVTWQKQLFIKIYATGITIPGMKKILSSDESEITLYFYPNRLATRAEVFGFARNVVGNEKTDLATENKLFVATSEGNLLNIFLFQPLQNKIIFSKKIVLEDTLSFSKNGSSGASDVVQYDKKRNVIFYVTSGSSEYDGSCRNKDGTCVSRIYKIGGDQQKSKIIFEMEQPPHNWIFSDDDNSIILSFVLEGVQTIKKINAETGKVLFSTEYQTPKGYPLGDFVLSKEKKFTYQVQYESSDQSNGRGILKLLKINNAHGNISEENIYSGSNFYASVLSPNDDYIAFYSGAFQSGDLFIYQISTKKLIDVPYKYSVKNYNLFWSGDSTKLMMILENGLMYYDLDKSKIFPIEGDPQNTNYVYNWSPSGKYFTYEGNNKVKIYDMENSQEISTNINTEHVSYVVGMNWYSTTEERRIGTDVDVLQTYYNLLSVKSVDSAYSMRSPAGVSLATFTSWYKNTDYVTFREDTVKDLGNNTYEFLVDMTESGVKSTYKVKSKVNLEKFTIDNISSVKQ